MLANCSTNPNGAISVSDALQIAKIGLETIKVRIIGEVSQVSSKRGYSAVYFTIKDAKCALPCLMWKNKYDSCEVTLELGMKVELTGKFSVYPAKGTMNFSVDTIEVAGEGYLRQQVAMLQKKLETMGLTDPSIKKLIPKMPDKIGVITSSRGSVIHDVIRTLKRRMPIANVVFAGCSVEGKKAPQNMIYAFDVLEKSKPDVIILCRGGGSFEDLMPFNDEALALRIAKCDIPVVTGIGHEPDTTIADLVSDLRASTPTAAAEAVSIYLSDYLAEKGIKLNNFKNALLNRLKVTNDLLSSYAKRPIFADPKNMFANQFQQIDYTSEKLANIMKSKLNDCKNLIGISAAKLEDKSPLTILSRGYAVALDENGKVVKSIDGVEAGKNINVKVSDGDINCDVISVNGKC